MEGIAAHARQLQALLNQALDLEADMKRLVATIDFTPDDWSYMYKNHRLLAHELSALAFKYGPE